MTHMLMSVRLHICTHIVSVSSSVKHLLLECLVYAQGAFEVEVKLCYGMNVFMAILFPWTCMPQPLIWQA